MEFNWRVIGGLANCHFIKDKAYTMDDVLVYNVFVYNIPKQTTNTEFSEYFKRFGDIESVYLYRDHIKKPCRKLGFVNYKDPLSAAIALQNTFHAINKKPICVKACDSWHQPGAKPSAANATVETECTPNDALLLNLNDDCLDNIFKQLQLNDQINLAQCCRRLQDVFIMRAKAEYKILDIEDVVFLTLCQIRQFFQMTGSQIEKLACSTSIDLFTRVVKYLGIYCLNVKSVIIKGVRLTATNMRNLLKNIHMVEELHLNDADLKDDCILVLKKLKKLKILSLERNYDLTGRHINALTTLESLSLNSCMKISSSLLEKISKNLIDLKYLDIQKCSYLNLPGIKNIVKYMHKLETIKISCDNAQVDCIASLPSLKHLHLNNDRSCDPVPVQIFVELAKHRADQLETLAVCGYNCINYEKTEYIGELRKLKQLICTSNSNFDDNCLSNISQLQELELLNIADCKSFSDKALLDLVQKCPKLSTLNVSYCEQLNEEFAAMVLHLLISEQKQRDQKKPLKIIAYGSGINYFPVNTTEFMSATDLLSISHEYEMDGVDIEHIVGLDIDNDDIYDDLYDNPYDDDDYYGYPSQDSDDTDIY